MAAREVQGEPGAWLPDHQLHVVATLAHVDDLVARVAATLFDYVRPPGPLQLQEVAAGSQTEVKVKAVAPLPESISRGVADALTQMRAALEHVLFAEVVRAVDGPLTSSEARGVEMPASTSWEEFQRWLDRRPGKLKHVLRYGSPLADRLEALQPYHRRDRDDHPLRVLTQYTNVMKHRTPAFAATHLATVRAEVQHPEFLARRYNRPLRPGDVLATGPRGVVIPLAIVPAVLIQRPHSETWHVLLHELDRLERWVRRNAVPILTVGTDRVTALPPHLDITKAYADLRAALKDAKDVAAAERAQRRLLAAVGREDLPELLMMLPHDIEQGRVRRWVATLDDDQVGEQLARLARTQNQGRLASIVDQVREDLEAFERRATPEA